MRRLAADPGLPATAPPPANGPQDAAARFQREFKRLTLAATGLAEDGPAEEAAGPPPPADEPRVVTCSTPGALADSDGAVAADARSIDRSGPARPPGTIVPGASVAAPPLVPRADAGGAGEGRRAGCRPESLRGPEAPDGLPANGWTAWTGQFVDWARRRAHGEARAGGATQLRLTMDPAVLPDSVLCLTMNPRRFALRFEVGHERTMHRLGEHLPELRSRLAEAMAEGITLELQVALRTLTGDPS